MAYNMHPNPSLVNYNGSAPSVQSNGTHRHRSSGRTNTSNTTTLSDNPRPRQIMQRNHTFPTMDARNIRYANNSAAGYDAYRVPGEESLNQQMNYQDVGSFESFVAGDAAQAHSDLMFTEPSYTSSTYESELNLEDDEDFPADARNWEQTSQSYPRSYQSDNNFDIQPRNMADYYNAEEHLDGAYPQPTSTYYHDDRHDPEQEAQYGPSSSRSHSPSTRRYIRTQSTEERLRLGLSRYDAGQQDQGYVSRHRSSRRQ